MPYCEQSQSPSTLQERAIIHAYGVRGTRHTLCTNQAQDHKTSSFLHLTLVLAESARTDIGTGEIFNLDCAANELSVGECFRSNRHPGVTGLQDLLDATLTSRTTLLPFSKEIIAEDIVVKRYSLSLYSFGFNILLWHIIDP